MLLDWSGILKSDLYREVSLRIPSRTDFSILREDRDWLVVAKPAPLLIHPTGKEGEVTLLSLLRRERPGEELFLVNRLDRETSGCVLVARSSGAARRLGKQVARREIRKDYLAMVQGWPDWEQKRVTAGLRRKGEFAESAIWVRQGVHAEGRESVTHFQVERRWQRKGRPFALLRCFPQTGRTHQIRAHLELLDLGIVGDKIYGGDESAYLDFLRVGWTADLARRLLLERQALHAARLAFEWEGKTITVTCDLPSDLKRFCIV